jgi:hypothetical protein
MTKFYRVRSEAYFSPSRIFVNGRNHDDEKNPYPVDWENVGGGVHPGTREQPRSCRPTVVEKLRMRVDIVAVGRLASETEVSLLQLPAKAAFSR